MRILFLTPTLPFPPIGGEKLRPFYFLKYLCKKHQVTLLSFVENEEEVSSFKDYDFGSLSIYTVRLPKLWSYSRCLQGLFSTLPLEISYYASRSMFQLVQQQLDACQFDLVFCHLIRMSDYVKDLAIKKILDVSDALSLRYQISYHLRCDIFKLIEFVESKRLKQYEAGVMEKFDLNLIASARDKEYFSRFLSNPNLLVVPNGVETKLSVLNIVTDQKKLVFFGNFRAFPNQDAFIYFYRKIFPLVKKRINDVKFIVVGAGIERKFYALAFKDNALKFYRDVREIEPFVEDACVSVAPMRISVGIQNKILQSMALKVPVVATSEAVGGIAAVPGEDILLADNPQDFADKIVSLILDPGLRSKLSEQAYRLVQEYFQWPKIINRLEEACQKIIA